VKLLFENWRKYLSEQDTVLPTTLLHFPGGRPVVVVQTSEGSTAFYKSTGTDTGEESKGMWLPYGGLAQYRGQPWLVKLPSSHPQAKSQKFPKEGSEFWKIGEQLERSYYSGALRGLNWEKWTSSKGWPSPHEVEKMTDGKIPRNTYGNMMHNLFLSEKGALKPEWAPADGFYGIDKGLLGDTDGGDPGAEYTIEDLKKIIASGRITPGDEPDVPISFPGPPPVDTPFEAF